MTLLNTTVNVAESDASKVPAMVGVLSLVVLEVTVGVVGSTVSWVANTLPLVVVDPPTVTEAVTATVPSATAAMFPPSPAPSWKLQLQAPVEAWEVH